MPSTSTKRNTTTTSSVVPKKAKVVDTNVTVKKPPRDLYYDARNDFLNENKEIEGAILIRGIERTDCDSDSDSDTETEDSNNYTMEQMNSLRFVMLTKNRDEQLEKMRKLILGDQADHSCKMFNTSFSYNVMDSWEYVKRSVLPRKSPAQKLDSLLAFTVTIQQYNVWMHDNEGGMGVMAKGLAAAWKRLIQQNSDEQLGWDTQYTKPGVMELLKQFQSEIDAMDIDYDMGKFKYM